MLPGGISYSTSPCLGQMDFCQKVFWQNIILTHATKVKHNSKKELASGPNSFLETDIRVVRLILAPQGRDLSLPAETIAMRLRFGRKGCYFGFEAKGLEKEKEKHIHKKVSAWPKMIDICQALKVDI